MGGRGKGRKVGIGESVWNGRKRVGRRLKEEGGVKRYCEVC